MPYLLKWLVLKNLLVWSMRRSRNILKSANATIFLEKKLTIVLISLECVGIFLEFAHRMPPQNCCNGTQCAFATALASVEELDSVENAFHFRLMKLSYVINQGSAAISVSYVFAFNETHSIF